VKRGYLETSHGQLHYRCNGDRELSRASDTPLLLLHQSPSDSRMYGKLMALLDADFWMLAPDNPGFGNSDPLPGGFSLQGCVDAILALLDTLEVPGCYLFGHHTGASIAAELAARAPERVVRLAMSGPTLLGPDLKQALPGKAAPIPEDDEGNHLTGMWGRMAAKEAGAPRDLLLREVVSAFSAGDSYAEAYAAVAEQDFEALLRLITAPTLVFAGTDDILYSQLEPSFQCLQQGVKREIQGAASFVCETRPDEVASLLREFFQDE
jgi:pimeloyl-ACP methyl ester carboxylesterase